MLKINSYYEYKEIYAKGVSDEPTYFHVISKLKSGLMEIRWSDDWGLDTISEDIDENVNCREVTENEFILSKIK
tara:strand:- start:1074 stop:1295 length:222 start_codon:yes stop_codon:yes gene_type:complete